MGRNFFCHKWLRNLIRHRSCSAANIWGFYSPGVRVSDCGLQPHPFFLAFCQDPFKIFNEVWHVERLGKFLHDLSDALVFQVGVGIEE